VQTDRQDKSASGYEPASAAVTKKPAPLSELGESKGRASNLKSKFEQLAAESQRSGVDVKAKEEKERRKNEDERLAKEQAQQEHQRQQRIEKEWEQRGPDGEPPAARAGAMPTAEAGGEEDRAEGYAKPRHSIGVRLPIASGNQSPFTSSGAAAGSDGPPKPQRSTDAISGGEPAVGEGVAAQQEDEEPKHQPRVPVLGGGGGIPLPPMAQMLRRRKSSASDKEVGEDISVSVVYVNVRYS